MNKKRDFILATIICIVALLIAALFIFNQTPGKYAKEFTNKEMNAVELDLTHLVGNADYGSPMLDFSSTLIGNSHTAVVAEYKGRETYDSKYDIFTKLQVLYGEVNTEDIKAELDFTLNINFEAGKKYILFLNYKDLIYKPFPCYQITNALPYLEGGSYDDEYSYFYDHGLDHNLGSSLPVCTVKFANLKGGYEISGFIKRLAEKFGYDYYGTFYAPKLFRGEDLETVTDNCEYLLKVKVNSEYERVGYSQYECTVLEPYKRKSLTAKEITVQSIKDSLETDKEYILVLCPTYSLKRENKLFMLAADNGIIPVDNKSLTEEFYKYYNK